MLWSLNAKIVGATAWHGHDIFEFIYCHEGSGELELEEQKIDLQPGRTLLIAPGIRHRFNIDSGQVAAFKILCLNTHDLATFLSPAQVAFMEKTREVATSHADHQENQAGIREILALIPDGFDISDIRELRVVWGAIGVLLAMHGKAQKSTSNQDGQKYRQKILEIVKWVDTQLHATTSLEALAEQFGMSRSLLTREFRRYTGKSFIDYCNSRRVEKAALILASSKESITRIALESGFSNLSHFHRQFKSIYGLTPAVFRRQIFGTP